MEFFDETQKIRKIFSECKWLLDVDYHGSETWKSKKILHDILHDIYDQGHRDGYENGLEGG